MKRKLSFRKISGRSKVPYLTVNAQLGKVFINKKGIDICLFNKGDIIGFYEVGDDLYLKKAQDESEGFVIYSYGNEGRTFGFSHKETVEWLFNKFSVDIKSGMFRLEINSTMDNGVFYLTKMQ
jgi:hypothetical protein